MDKQLFFKFCHDILSPVNALGLILDNDSLDTKDIKLANFSLQKLIYIVENYRTLLKESNDEKEMENENTRKRKEIISKLFITKNLKINSLELKTNDYNLIKIIHTICLLIYDKASASGALDSRLKEDGAEISFNSAKINFNEDFVDFLTNISKNFLHSKKSDLALQFFLSKILKDAQYKIITKKNENEIIFYIKKNENI